MTITDDVTRGDNSKQASSADLERLVAAAREMRPRLLERAPEAERQRRLPQATIDELHDSGLVKYFTPARWGGFGGDVRGQLAISTELAKGCPSTAWVYTLLCYTTAFAGSFLGEEGAGAVYSSERPTVCGVAAATGQAVPVDGGYRVTGSWGFTSGCLHAEWIMVNAEVVNDVGEAVDQVVLFMPMSQLTIKDTWYVVGMRGTGSNTVVADDLFVPSSMSMLLRERIAAEANHRPDVEAVDRIPFALLFSVGLMGPTLGMAATLLELVSANAHKRGISYFNFDKQTDSAVTIETIGEAAMQIDTASLHVQRAATVLDVDTRHGQLSLPVRARCRADSGHASENLRQAVGTLMSIAGASAFAESSRLQSLWRDINVASRHAFVNTKPLYETYGRALLGVEPNITNFL